MLKFFWKKSFDENTNKVQQTKQPNEENKTKILNINKSELWGEIIKYLRENNHYAIFACSNGVSQTKIENDKFVIFTTKNGYELLSAPQNKIILQNAINQFAKGLILDIINNEEKENNNIEKFLKDKLGNVEIKD